MRIRLWPRGVTVFLAAVGLMVIPIGTLQAAPAHPYVLPDGTILGQSGTYAVVNGVKLYYEIHGEGEPLLLIHGDMAPIETWIGMLPELMRHYRVIIPERRGHFRSFDNTTSYSYSLFASDLVALLDELAVSKAAVVGHSGGAVTGLMLVYEHPERVSRFVSISGWFNRNGYTYESFQEASAFTAANPGEDLALAPGLYRRISPMGPNYWPIFWAKMSRLHDQYPSLTPSDLAQIETPMLVMAADRDYFRLQHTAGLFEGVIRNPDPAADRQNRQLAIIPGTTHMLILEKPDFINTLILDFLGQVPTHAEGAEKG